MKEVLPAEVERHRFTVEEYHKMAEAGLFSEDDRVELIDGEIVEMTPIGWRHANCVNDLTMFLTSFARGRYVVSVQNPLTISDHGEPQPDLVLLKRRPRGRLPDPDDVALLIEVSDTTLAYDRDVKLPRYARAGIPEVWIVDLEGRRIEAHSAPSADGYGTSREFGPGERVSSASVEGLSLPVDEILG